MAFPKNCSHEIAKRLGVPEVEVLAAALASQNYPAWAPSTAGGPVFLEGSDDALASAIDRLHGSIGMKLSREVSDDHREPGYAWGNVDPRAAM